MRKLTYAGAIVAYIRIDPFGLRFNDLHQFCRIFGIEVSSEMPRGYITAELLVKRHRVNPYRTLGDISLRYGIRKWIL